MIFLDNASTTKLLPIAVDKLVEYSTQKFYNPSAFYKVAYENYKEIENAKKKICEILNVKFENNIIFTGTATEASNLAIMGSYRKHFKKMLFSMGEHPSVYNTALNLKNNGVDVEFINLQENGEIDYADLEKKLDENVNFISIMAVSNETGAINDLVRIDTLRKKYCKNAIFHCDGVQGFGKIKIELNSANVDFFTLSAHKINGPKGIGALYAKNPAKLIPQVYGGGQEYNIRSGTENLASIMAFYEVLKNINIDKNLEIVKNLKNIFLDKLIEKISKNINIRLFKNNNSSPYIISLSIPKIKAETLVYMCDENGLLISTGSACSSKKSGNRVLENCGYTKQEIEGNIRVSFSALTTEEEVVKGSEILAEQINQLYKRVN